MVSRSNEKKNPVVFKAIGLYDNIKDSLFTMIREKKK